jgi:hypothetical protein
MHWRFVCLFGIAHNPQMIIVHIRLHLLHKNLAYLYQPTCSIEKFFILICSLINSSSWCGWKYSSAPINNIYVIDDHRVVWCICVDVNHHAVTFICRLWKPPRAWEVLPIFLLTGLFNFFCRGLPNHCGSACTASRHHCTDPPHPR